MAVYSYATSTKYDIPKVERREMLKAVADELSNYSEVLTSDREYYPSQAIYDIYQTRDLVNMQRDLLHTIGMDDLYHDLQIQKEEKEAAEKKAESEKVTK